MKTESVEICPACKGRGYVTEEHLTDYHKGEYEITKRTCKRCNGSGLVKVATITERREEPYDPQSSLNS